MKILKIITAALLSACLALPVSAGTTTAGFFACDTEARWEEVQSAGLAGAEAFKNKLRSFVLLGACLYVPAGAKCVTTDVGFWSGIDEVYVNDIGPVYKQNEDSKARKSGCSRHYNR